jgi:hypothetical protein
MRDPLSLRFLRDLSVTMATASRGKREIGKFEPFVQAFATMFPELHFARYGDQRQFDTPDQLHLFNKMMFAMRCHGSGLLNVIWMQSNTVFVVVESRQSDGNLFIAIAKVFRRHVFVFKEFRFNHFSRKVWLQMKFVMLLVEAGIRRAREIEKRWSAAKESKLSTAVLGRGFVIEGDF